VDIFIQLWLYMDMELETLETRHLMVDKRSTYSSGAIESLASAAFDALALIDKLPTPLSPEAQQFVVAAAVDEVDAGYQDAAVIVGYLNERRGAS